MEINKRLAFIEQLFDEFERLVDSLDRKVIVPVPDALKSRVSDVTCDLINHINALEAKLTDRVWDTGHVAMPEISERLLGKYQRKVRPARNKIQKIFAELDPETAELFRLLDGPGSRLTELRHVRQTFESGIEKMEELIQDCPDMEEHFLVQPARAIIDSPLIRFEPDDWIVNARSLRSVLLSGRDRGLPPHVRIRLQELYRSFIFGNWIAVIGLARAVMEFAIVENRKQLQIETEKVIEIHGKPRWVLKSLEELIDAVTEKRPHLLDNMDRVRKLGNYFIHPQKDGNDSPFDRRDCARECIEQIQLILAALYLEPALCASG